MIRIEGVEGFEKCLNMTHSIFQRDYAKFRYKINRLFINPRLEKFLESDEIDMIIVNAIGQWGKFAEDHPSETFLAIRKRQMDHEYFRQEITKAMLDENLILFERYFKKVIPQHFIYGKYFSMEKEFLKKKMLNAFRFPIYVYFCLMKASYFRYSILSIGNRAYFFAPLKEGSEYTWVKYRHGYNIKYDVPNELYKGSTIVSFNTSYSTGTRNNLY